MSSKFLDLGEEFGLRYGSKPRLMEYKDWEALESRALQIDALDGLSVGDRKKAMAVLGIESEIDLRIERKALAARRARNKTLLERMFKERDSRFIEAASLAIRLGGIAAKTEAEIHEMIKAARAWPKPAEQPEQPAEQPAEPAEPAS